MPLGVVAVVYEARPNVTIDAAALCLKSGNAIVLRGSSSALHSNAALARIAGEAAVAGGLPEGCVSLVAGGGREELAELATQKGTVDLIIPRGGEGLKAALEEVATVPVIYAASGNCHVYVDASADLDQAEAIVLNAKTQRPGVCNAAETLLIHEQIAARVRAADRARARRRRRGRARGRARDSRGDASGARRGVAARGDRVGSSRRREEDWGTEYLAMTLAVKVVDSIGAGDRAHRPLRQRAFRGDRDPRHRERAGVSAGGGRGLRVRERLDEVHRRGRVRDGRGDRQLDAEAARARADRAAGAVHVQVPGRRRRTRPRLRSRRRRAERSVDRHPRRDVQPAPSSGTSHWPGTRRPSWAWSGCVLMPAHSAPHKGDEEDPGPQRRLEMCRLAVGERGRAGGLRSGDRARRAVLYGGYLESDPCRAIQTAS